MSDSRDYGFLVSSSLSGSILLNEVDEAFFVCFISAVSVMMVPFMKLIQADANDSWNSYRMDIN